MKHISKIIGIALAIFVLVFSGIAIAGYSQYQKDKDFALSELTGKVTQNTGSKYWLTDTCTVSASTDSLIASNIETYNSNCVRTLESYETKINAVKSAYSSDSAILETTGEVMSTSEKLEYIDGFRIGEYIFSSNICLATFMCGDRYGAFTHNVISIRAHLLSIADSYKIYPTSTFEEKGEAKAMSLFAEKIRTSGIMLW